MRNYLVLGFLVSSMLVACSKPVAVNTQPEIEFIGIAPGNLQTDLSTLAFKDRYEVTDRELLGIVQFKNVSDGTTVQATWFSPDDRRMPLGRRYVTTESGAKIARFSFANSVDWEPAPYMLDIWAKHGEGEEQLTASGQVHFYIGMTDEEVDGYKADWDAHQAAEADRRFWYNHDQEIRDGILEDVRTLFSSTGAQIVLVQDLGGDLVSDLVIVDPPVSFPSPSSISGALLEQYVDKFSVNTMSGVTLLSLLSENDKGTLKNSEEDLLTLPSDKGFTLVVLSSSDILLMPGTRETATCEILLKFEDGMYVVSEDSCS